jgi:lambda family phage portal protein
MSADRAALKDAGIMRARARDLVRNNAFAANAVRMNRDSVSGSGLKLALKIDWRSLGITDIEVAAEWQDQVCRAWEAHAEGVDCQIDARRQQTFSQLFALADQTDYVDGENLAILEMKPGFGAYQTCINLIDVDRLSNPDGRMDDNLIRGGVERDVFGEPIAYHIREGHPQDVALGIGQLRWKRVMRATDWGRPICLHTFDHQRPEMTRGVSAFSTSIVPMKMLSIYEDTELERAITQAAYAAVIKTELDWSKAMQVVGAKAASINGSNPLVDMELGLMAVAAQYAEKRDLNFRGSQVHHLLPNESLELLRSESPNGNFEAFESNFIRKLAAGLGVEAHELGKNYKDVNYSAARAALLSVWRTYRARRIRLISQFAMPVFSAWLEEAVALGAVPLPKGVGDFLAAKPYLCKGSYIAWGKPMIDPMKERQAQQLGIQMGTETLESVSADEGENWRDNVDQIAFEKAYCAKLGVPHPSEGMMGQQMGQQMPQEEPGGPPPASESE